MLKNITQHGVFVLSALVGMIASMWGIAEGVAAAMAALALLSPLSAWDAVPSRRVVPPCRMQDGI